MRPIVSQYNHIHKAMGGELLKVEAQAAMLDANDPQAVEALAGHIGMIKTILDVHAHEEEDGAWKMIEAKFPGITQPYLLDHDQERALFTEIYADLGKLQSPGGEDRESTGRRLYRNIVAVTSHLIHHMSKEEKHPYSTFAESLSEEEELQIVGAVLSSLPEDLLSQALPWEMSYLTAEEIAEDIGICQRTLSPEKQALIIGAIINGLPPERRDAVLTLAPEAGAYKN